MENEMETVIIWGIIGVIYWGYIGGWDHGFQNPSRVKG